MPAGRLGIALLGSLALVLSAGRASAEGSRLQAASLYRDSVANFDGSIGTGARE